MRLIKAYHLLLLIGSVCTHLSVICAQQSEPGMVVDGLQVKFDTGRLTYRNLPAEFKEFRCQPILHVQLIGREDVPAFGMKFTLKSDTSIKHIIPAAGSRIYGDQKNMMEVNLSVPKLAKGQKMNFYVILGRELDRPTLKAEVHITRTIGKGGRFRGPGRDHDGQPGFLLYNFISIEDLVPNFSTIKAPKLLLNMDKSDSAASALNLVTTMGSTEQDEQSALLLADLLETASDLAHGFMHFLAEPQQTSAPVELINSTSQSEREKVVNTQSDESAF